MKVELEIRNPEELGETLYSCFRLAWIKEPKIIARAMPEWSEQPSKVKAFWGSVARNLIHSTMGLKVG